MQTYKDLKIVIYIKKFLNAHGHIYFVFCVFL